MIVMKQRMLSSSIWCANRTEWEHSVLYSHLFLPLLVKPKSITSKCITFQPHPVWFISEMHAFQWNRISNSFLFCLFSKCTKDNPCYILQPVLSHLSNTTLVFADNVGGGAQVIKLMNSILNLVTCGFSFLGILVQEVDLLFVVKDDLVHKSHLGFMLIRMSVVLYTIVLGVIHHMQFYLPSLDTILIRALGTGRDQSTISICIKLTDEDFQNMYSVTLMYHYLLNYIILVSDLWQRFL